MHLCATSVQGGSFQLKVKGLSKLPVIAVVDDDTAVRTGIDSLIRSLGWRACLFASAMAFLDSDCLNQADCLITDVQMPEMSGLQLHEQLTARGFAIPTLFITAFPEDSIRRRAMTGSAVGFLAKPFSAQALIDCLESALA